MAGENLAATIWVADPPQIVSIIKVVGGYGYMSDMPMAAWPPVGDVYVSLHAGPYASLGHALDAALDPDAQTTVHHTEE